MLDPASISSLAQAASTLNATLSKPLAVVMTERSRVDRIKKATDLLCELMSQVIDILVVWECEEDPSPLMAASMMSLVDEAVGSSQKLAADIQRTSDFIENASYLGEPVCFAILRNTPWARSRLQALDYTITTTVNLAANPAALPFNVSTLDLHIRSTMVLGAYRLIVEWVMRVLREVRILASTRRDWFLHLNMDIGVVPYNTPKMDLLLNKRQKYLERRSSLQGNRADQNVPYGVPLASPRHSIRKRSKGNAHVASSLENAQNNLGGIWTATAFNIVACILLSILLVMGVGAFASSGR